MGVQFLYSKEKEALLMTINQVISLINIKDIPFVPQMSGVREKGKLPIYSSKQGVCYWNGESIWSIGINQNSQNEIYKIKQSLKNCSWELANNDRELDKYVAVYEILYAINEYKGIDDNIKFDTIKRYVEILNKEILDSLDFQQILEMETLKNLIIKDKLYNQMLFNVHEVHSTKERQFSEYKIEKKDYSFGNIQYHEELDRVHITIYDDVVEISCTKEARGSYERKLDKRKKYTSEDKIISALDCWRCNFWN